MKIMDITLWFFPLLQYWREHRSHKNADKCTKSYSIKSRTLKFVTMCNTIAPVVLQPSNLQEYLSQNMLTFQPIVC